MIEEMQEEYVREVVDGRMVLLPRMGMVCVAKFSRDSKFHRAEVMNILKGGMVMVVFVDYGTSEVLEAAGLILPRPHCSTCGRQPRDKDIRIRDSHDKDMAEEPGGVQFQHKREQAHWRCGRCTWERSVGVGAEAWSEGYTLRQNAGLICGWAKAAKPSSETLAEDEELARA